MVDVFTEESGWEWHYDDSDPTTLTRVVRIGSASTEVGIIQQLDVGTDVLVIAANCFNDAEGHKITKVLSMPGNYTTIGASAFSGCTLLTSVVIGRGVTSIGASAFASCIALTSVTIPNAVITIGASAFSGDVALTTATIGSAVTTIGASTFSGCTSLASIYFVCKVAPTSVGANWILNAPAGILGHAYYSSDFPLPGAAFNGLTMSTYNITYNIEATADSAGLILDGADYTTVHDATDSSAPTYAGLIGQNGLTPGSIEVARTVMIFDTSIIPKQELITSAKLRMYCRTNQSTTDFDIVLQLGDPQHPGNPVVAADYNYANYDGADGDYNEVKSTSTISAGAEFELILTSIGFLLINTGGKTRLMIRSSRDIDSTNPGSGIENMTVPPPTFLNPEETETTLIITATPPVESSGTTFEYLSAAQLSATIGATAADVNLPDVVVPALPTGYNIYRATMFLKFRVVENTNAAANQLNGNQNVLIKKGSGPFANCLQLKDNMFPVLASTSSDGITLYGELDLTAVVTGAATYSFQIKNALSDQDSIVLHDVQVGLRIVMKNY